MTCSNITPLDLDITCEDQLYINRKIETSSKDFYCYWIGGINDTINIFLNDHRQLVMPFNKEIWKALKLLKNVNERNNYGPTGLVAKQKIYIDGLTRA